MKVVVAPDSWGGTLTARQAATAIAAGWQMARPDDEVVTCPLADGGEGLLDVVARPEDEVATTEVAGPLGHPVLASWLRRPDGTAVIESAAACGLARLPGGQRRAGEATTYGVGQLIEAARGSGAPRILVGLGGSATTDGGAGALTALGFRLRRADGSGLKIGGIHLHELDRVERTWVAPYDDVEVVLLTDVDCVLAEAAPRFGPQKGAGPEEVRWLAQGLAHLADVVERDLDVAGVPPLRELPGTGAAGGLGYGLVAGLGARFAPGAAAVAELVGLAAALEDADVVLTGEGRLDATTAAGKVAAHVAAEARARGLPVAAVVGSLADPAVPAALGLAEVAAASPEGPGPDPGADAQAAARRLAESWS